jgi:peptidoglycan/xylan/chitin deacetylase (PgdA/CDA1 family)
MRLGVARLKQAFKLLVGSAHRARGVVGVNYHRIGDSGWSGLDRGLWSATEDDFDHQLRWLKEHFDVISPHEIADALEVRRGRHALVTFDDGYLDNFTTAYPILRARRVPATFFVVTGFIDHGRCVPWWDELAWMVHRSRRASLALPPHLPAPVELDELGRERAIAALNRAYRALPPCEADALLDAVCEATGTGRLREARGERLWMTWDMLRELRAAGMTIGGHTMSHRMLSRLSREEQAREIDGCGERLRTELGEPMRMFSYPFGKQGTFDDDTRACLREAGVELAFTYWGGFCRPGPRDPYATPRIAIEREHVFDGFRAEVLGAWL